MREELTTWASNAGSEGQRPLIRRQNAITLAIVMLVGLGSPPKGALAAVFAIDPAQSSVSLTATLLGLSIAEQGPGSLTTSLSGTINADLSPTAIQFTGGSSLNASTNGSWQPLPGGGAGSAPADFAASAQSPLFGTIVSAVRDVTLDLQSAVLPLNGVAFDGSQIQIMFPTNSTAAFDYSAGLLAGSKSLAGASTNKLVSGATVTVSNGVQILTLPIETQFSFSAFLANDSAVSFTGNIVATRPLESTNAAPMMIQSIVLGNSQVILRVNAVPGSSYRVESSADLRVWTACPYELSPTGDGFMVSRDSAAQSRFYRIAR